MQVATLKVWWPVKFGDALVTINASDFTPAIHHTEKPVSYEKETEKTPQAEVVAPKEEPDDRAEVAHQVFALALAGNSNQQIAAVLGVTPQKVMAIKRYDLSDEQKAQLN